MGVFFLRCDQKRDECYRTPSNRKVVRKTRRCVPTHPSHGVLHLVASSSSPQSKQSGEVSCAESVQDLEAAVTAARARKEDFGTAPEGDCA